MDAKDVRIFCEIAFSDQIYGGGSGRRTSPADIGRILGLDQKTVRLRVRKMEDAGFIKYHQATPDLGLFGLRNIGLYRLEAMNIATKAAVLKYIHGVPGVVEAFDYLGPTVSLSVAGATATKVEQVADEVAGRFELNKLSLGDHKIRELRVSLDGLDWQIIEKLRYDARCTAKDVSDALSITPRMAGYRIDKLRNSGAVLTKAVINAQKQGGLVFYELVVAVDEARRNAIERHLREVHGEKLWHMKVSAAGVLVVNLFGFTLGEPEESAMGLMKAAGVRWCTILILKEIIEPGRPNWIDVLIREEIERSRTELH